MNRALKKGVLVRLVRGLYCLSTSVTKAEFLPHPFAVAQAMQSLSYISFETALEFHRWIPEAVYTTASVTPNSKSLAYEHKILGRFSFSPIAVEDSRYLESVNRIKFENNVALIASPLRALMDLVEKRKQAWEGIGWIEDGLRIDEDDFLTLPTEDFTKLKGVYKHNSTKKFLKEFEIAVFDRKQQMLVATKTNNRQSND